MGIRKINIIETLKSKIELNQSSVVKQFRSLVIANPKTWLKHYQSLCELNPHLVKVYNINEQGTEIVMENLGKIITIEDLLKDANYFKLVNKNILCDILYAVNYSWAQSFAYSKQIAEDGYFMNTDVTLHNIVLTESQEIKQLDHDSYSWMDTIPGESWAFDFSEKYYMTQINLMSKIQKFNYVQLQ